MRRVSKPDNNIKKLAHLVYATVKVLNQKGIYPSCVLIQKIVYLLLFLAHRDLLSEFYYKPYPFAPYSHSVLYVLNALQISGYLIEQEGKFHINQVKELQEECVVCNFLDFLERCGLNLSDESELEALAKVHWALTKSSEGAEDLCEENVEKYSGTLQKLLKLNLYSF